MCNTLAEIHISVKKRKDRFLASFAGQKGAGEVRTSPAKEKLKGCIGKVGKPYRFAR